MKFKLTNKKLILGIILGILVSLLMSYLIAKYSCWSSAPLCTINSCPKFINPCNMWNQEILMPSLILYGLITFILTYVVYSLIEKKK